MSHIPATLNQVLKSALVSNKVFPIATLLLLQFVRLTFSRLKRPKLPGCWQHCPPEQFANIHQSNSPLPKHPNSICKSSTHPWPQQDIHISIQKASQHKKQPTAQKQHIWNSNISMMLFTNVSITKPS